MKNIVQFIKISCLTLLILVLTELISLGVNNYKNSPEPFLIDTALISLKIKPYDETGRHGYHLIDPLLGWGISNNTIENKGLETEFNCIVLKSEIICDNPYNILLTGGSTSDLIINPANWPVNLAEVLQENNVCANIYIGAVGGFSSGQEVLKLIRDGQKIKIDLHVSYSGANESGAPNYVSRQEESIFIKNFEGVLSHAILPNTMALIKAKKPKQLELYQLEDNNPATFWLKNMQIMQAINISNDASFIGVLQPLLGIHNQHQQKVITEYKDYITNNQLMYSNISNQLNKHAYLADLSHLFDSSKEEIFIDDCHIHDQYQKIVAEGIFDIIEEKKIFDDPPSN